MAFVQKKTVHGRDTFYLVATRQVGRDVRQIVLCCLGSNATIEAAANYWLEMVDQDKRKAELFEQRAAMHRPGNLLNQRRYGNCRYCRNMNTADQYKKRVEETQQRLAQIRPYISLRYTSTAYKNN